MSWCCRLQALSKPVLSLFLLCSGVTKLNPKFAGDGLHNYLVNRYRSNLKPLWVEATGVEFDADDVREMVATVELVGAFLLFVPALSSGVLVLLSAMMLTSLYAHSELGETGVDMATPLLMLACCVGAALQGQRKPSVCKAQAQGQSRPAKGQVQSRTNKKGN